GTSQTSDTKPFFRVCSTSARGVCCRFAAGTAKPPQPANRRLLMGKPSPPHGHGCPVPARLARRSMERTAACNLEDPLRGPDPLIHAFAALPRVSSVVSILGPATRSWEPDSRGAWPPSLTFARRAVRLPLLGS